MSTIDLDGHMCAYGYYDPHLEPKKFEEWAEAAEAAGERSIQEAEAWAMEQPSDSGWTSTPPTSGEYVTVSDWSRSAGGFHHEGIALNSSDTIGWSTADPTTPSWKRIFWAVPGNLENDIEHHTKAGTEEIAPHTYLYHSITAKQSAAILQAFLKLKESGANKFSGKYNLLFHNCAQVVESLLRAGGVPNIPHGEVFVPAVLHSVLLHDRAAQ
jgi:leucyl aminopeptidase (aminopeptidase T)